MKAKKPALKGVPKTRSYKKDEKFKKNAALLGQLWHLYNRRANVVGERL
jgi:hypothetical protein